MHPAALDELLTLSAGKMFDSTGDAQSYIISVLN